MIVPILIGGALILLLATHKTPEQKHDTPTTARRKTKGHSGHTWFTAGLPVDDGNTVRTAVFASESGNDQIITYRTVVAPTAGVKQGDRFLEFQAPSALTSIAVGDFGPFVNNSPVAVSHTR